MYFRHMSCSAVDCRLEARLRRLVRTPRLHSPSTSTKCQGGAMKRQVFSLLCSLVFLGSSSVAQTVYDGITMPRSHPSLWFDPARLAQAKTWWLTHSYTPNSSDWVGIAFRHLMTGADCSTAVNQAANYSFNLTGSGSDDVRQNGEYYLLVYDWCHDQFTSGQESSLISHYNTALTHEVNDSWHFRRYHNNYFWGNYRNQLEF